jgi:cell division protein ZapA (FtsZ GTPase activity inhibitor)
MRADYSMNIQRNLKVTILGKNYSVSTDENEADIVIAAELVNQLIKSKIGKKIEIDQNVILIIALELATDLTKKERSLVQREKQLLDLVEQVL